MMNKSPLAHKVEVDASASLLKKCLKPCLGPEVVGHGQRPRFGQESSTHDQQPALR